MESIIFCFSWLPCFPREQQSVENITEANQIEKTRTKGSISTVESVNHFHGSDHSCKMGRDLYDCCWDGDLLGCVELLDKGANPNLHFGPKHTTALHAAVKTRNINVS